MSDPAAHFRLWLRAGMTGCEFAKLLAGRFGRVGVVLPAGADLPSAGWLNGTLELHAQADRVVLVVLPHIRSELALVELLNTLGTYPRWKVRRRAKPSPAGGVLVGLEWTTSSGDVSDAMGFGPFPAMPVPRRAPYVAIAAWPGGRSNPFRGLGPTPPARPGEVSFLDASHGFDAEKYEAMWSETTANVAALSTIPRDEPRLYRRTAFVISAENAAKLVER